MRRERSQHRVTALESLEGRLVLSNIADLTGIGRLVHAIAHIEKAHGKSGGAPTFAAVGDSLTDEYSEYAPDRSQARNLIEILAATNKANFGRYSKGGLGEPRNVGYAANWARSDAETGDVVADQLPGVLGQIRGGNVRYVSVLMGDNDFGGFLQQAPGLASDPPALIGRLVAVEAAAQANFDTTVNALLAANPRVRLVVGTIPDLTLTPVVKAQLAPFGAQGQLLSGLVSQAIGQYNAHIRAVAAGDPRIALADVAAGTVANLSQGPTIRFGGATIDVANPGDEYHHFFLADGYHPGTVGQGEIANTIINALDSRFRAGIRPLSEAQILHRAASARRYP